MKQGTKVLLIMLAVAAVVYFGGFGSTIFNNNYEASSIEGEGTFISRIHIQEPVVATGSNILYQYAFILSNNFRYANGTTGPIKYFYGGKASNIDSSTGLDPRFNTMVWGTNSSNQQFYKKYGLDCSGYIAYAMYLAGVRGFPDGSSNQYAVGESIALEEAYNGDLLIYRDSVTSKITHIGFLFFVDGVAVDMHCNSADNGIVSRPITGIGSKEDGFYWQEVVRNPYVTNLEMLNPLVTGLRDEALSNLD